MKTLIIITALTLPLGVFAQSNNINPQVQIQNVNYYDNINDDNNSIQTNIQNQQANPPAQMQQESQGSSFWGTGTNDNTSEKVHCKDCDAVKAALKASRATSGAHHGNSFNIKKWGSKFAGRMNMKMKKLFTHRQKVRTNYEVCFNWH